MLLLKGGRVLCPTTGIDALLDVRIADGRIVELGPDLAPRGEMVLDVTGAVVVPAFVDLCAELGDPGYTWREDLRSGSRAAAAGGYSVVLASPNTLPVVDSAPVASDLVARAAGLDGAIVLQSGALTVGLDGVELAELNLLAEAGCVAFSDGGRPITDTAVFRAALDYARPIGLPVLLRPGDALLEERGMMHEGEVSLRVGLHGIPGEAEEMGIGRAIALARLTGARVHLTHVTTAVALARLREARAAGLEITASVPARHLLLTDASLDRSGYDPDLRVLPPLRPEADRRAMVEAVRNGDLDAIISDHVPLTRVEKEHEFGLASAGAAGLETAFAAALTALDGDLDLVVRAMALGPAGVLGLERRVAVGAVADLTVVDPEWQGVISPPYKSRACNEPLEGHRVRGRVLATVVSGRLACQTAPSVIR